MNSFIAGIDGGGTRTTLAVRDAGGKDLGRREFGPFNYNSIGEEAFRKLLREIAGTLAGIGSCKMLAIGAAGVSNASVKQVVDEELSSIPHLLVSDWEIALEGAHAGGPGLAVIAGTGSVCFGKGIDGRIVRAGGWGHFIGDEGSAFALGRDAVSAVARWMDGWGEETVLSRLLEEKAHLRERTDIIHYVYDGGKAAVAALAPLVSEGCAEGDSVCLSIVEKNARDLALTANAVAVKAGPEAARIALFGGLLGKDTPMRRAFAKALERMNPGLRVVPPRADAVEGAVMLAGEALNRLNGGAQ